MPFGLVGRELDDEQPKGHRLDHCRDRRCVEGPGDKAALLPFVDDLDKIEGDCGLEATHCLGEVWVRKARTDDTRSQDPYGMTRRVADGKCQQFHNDDELGSRPSAVDRCTKCLDIAERLLSKSVELRGAHERIAILEVVVNRPAGQTCLVRNAFDRHGRLPLASEDCNGCVDQTSDCLFRAVLERALPVVALMCERLPTVVVDALGHTRQRSVASAALNVVLGRITAVVLAGSGS